MGIKIVQEGGMLVAKGNTAGTNVGYFFGFLFFVCSFLAGFTLTIWPPLFLAIIGAIILYASSHHGKIERIKKLTETQARYNATIVPQNTPIIRPQTQAPIVNPQTENKPPGIKCSNCGNETDAMNSFCPRCGFRIGKHLENMGSEQQQKYEEELKEARRKLEEDEKILSELERKIALKNANDTNKET